ncbi:MAG: GTP-binding protein [Clostridia bacterium]|nr:GTP-binding protein [Clostridia bacterium]
MVHGIKTDIISGFLGAGKTTLIKKLIKEAYAGEKVVLIENEFGEIGIDSGFLADAGVTVNEMNSGCICCSLVGDFGKALSQVIEDYAPERIIIEPSGVGKLSDIIRAVEGLHDERLLLNSYAAVVDAKKCRMYMKNFGEFFNDQIESAGAIIFSHTAGLSQKKIDEAVALVREHNPNAVMVATDWEALSGKDIVAAMERRDTLDADVKALEEETVCPECGHHHGHHHHHHDHDEECHCHEHEHHHHHDHDEECHCHEHEHHHHHDHDEECHCHEHEHHHHDHDGECHCHEHEHHHHDHDGECSCGCGHDHHHHHHADEVFASCGFETAHTFTEDALRAMLEALEDEHEYGMVLRAKGIVPSADGGEWLHFDYVPGEVDIRRGAASIIGRLCVIGAQIDKDKLKALFEL